MKALAYIFFLSLFSITACSDNEENQQQQSQTIHSGSIYIACDIGPIYPFSLDSLLANCSEEGGIVDSITSDYLNLGNTMSGHCNYDTDQASLSATNYDFRVFRANNPLSFNAEWQNNTFPAELINSSMIDGVSYNAAEHPFYTGWKFDLGNDEQLILLVFNVYIGGCLHDLIVWEYVE